MGWRVWIGDHSVFRRTTGVVPTMRGALDYARNVWGKNEVASLSLLDRIKSICSCTVSSVIPMLLNAVAIP